MGAGGRGREHLWALVGCIGLAVLLTWPLVTDLGHAIIGHERCTNLMHVWTYWAVHRGFADGEPPILFDYIFFPIGANMVRLYGSDLLYPVLFAPLQPWLDPGTAFDLKILFSMTVAPFGAYLLLRHLGVAFGPALAGGALFISTPYFLLETLNGVAELLAVEWLPFAVLFLLRALDGARLRDAALCALFTVLSVYASAYNAFFFALFAGVALVERMVYGPRPFFTRRRIGAGLALGALAILMMLPFVLLHRTGQTAASLQAKEGTFKTETAAPTADASADLVRFFRPGRNVIPEVFERNDGGRDEVYTTYTTYLGYGCLLLALVAMVQRRPRVRLWRWSFVLFFLIALGPYLRLFGEPVKVAGVPVALPSLFFYHYLPGFDVTARHTYRYVTMAHLSMAVLAGFGMQFLVNQLSRPLERAALPALALSLSLVEVLGFGPAPWPVPQTRVNVPQWYYSLANHTEREAVIELPFTRNHLKDLQLYLFYQTVHEKPYIDGGMHFRVEEEALDFYKSVPLAQNFLAEPTIHRPMSEALALLSTRLLQKRGYRWIIVHDDRFEDEAERELAHGYLKELYGAPREVGDQMKVYEIKMEERVPEG